MFFYIFRALDQVLFTHFVHWITFSLNESNTGSRSLYTTRLLDHVLFTHFKHWIMFSLHISSTGLCSLYISPDIILCLWLGSKHQLMSLCTGRVLDHVLLHTCNAGSHSLYTIRVLDHVLFTHFEYWIMFSLHSWCTGSCSLYTYLKCWTSLPVFRIS